MSDKFHRLVRVSEIVYLLEVVEFVRLRKEQADIASASRAVRELLERDVCEFAWHDLAITRSLRLQGDLKRADNRVSDGFRSVCGALAGLRVAESMLEGERAQHERSGTAAELEDLINSISGVDIRPG